MRNLLSDLRYALRTLAKTPGFTIVAVITLALGLGGTTAMYSLVANVLLKPLPYADSDRLVRIYESFPQGYGSVSVPNLEDWRAQSKALDRIGGYAPASYNMVAGGGMAPEHLGGVRVTDGFFATLGARARAGRLFTPEEQKAADPNVAVLSYGLWQRRFGGEPDVVGRTVALSGKPYTIVGVMEPTFELPWPKDIQLFVPLDRDANRDGRGNHFLSVIGHTAPGATFAQAKAELDTIAKRIATTYPDSQGKRGIYALTLQDQITAPVRQQTWLLFGAMVLVLVIACANVANMLLARAAARGGEIAVRVALGATRGRLVRLMLTEGALLALLGGAFGLIIADWGIDLCAAAMRLPLVFHPSLDAAAFGFAAAVSVSSVILFALAPALRSSRVDLSATLKEGGRRTSAARSRLRAGLVVAQVALSFALLAGAGLLGRSFLRLASVPPGFDPTNVVTLQLTLPDTRYPDDASAARFADRLLAEVRALPGVTDAGLTNFLPLENQNINGGFEVQGKTYPETTVMRTEYLLATPGYLKALRMPIVAGRDIGPGDVAGAPPVVVINQTLARTYFPNEDPLGKRIKIDWGGDFREIVGVVGDEHRWGLGAPAVSESFMPFAQRPYGDLSVAVRFAAIPDGASNLLRAAVTRVDAEQSVHDVTPLAALVSTSLARQRVNMTLLGAFALAALLLAAVGLYGVIAYQVAQRTRELGIRMALGARAAQVRRLVLVEGLRLVLIGLAVGFGGALLLLRLLSGLLYGVSFTDPVAYILTAAALAASAFVACWVPARRATRIDPMIALRAE